MSASDYEIVFILRFHVIAIRSGGQERLLFDRELKGCLRIQLPSLCLCLSLIGALFLPLQDLAKGRLCGLLLGVLWNL